DVLKAILEADNYRDAKIVFDASKPTMIPKRLIDNTKAKDILGFEAKTSLMDGIEETVKWYKNKISKI
ncbi:MAG: GDP-L-fucose synthase, partial [Candidatus Pacebacteria bacterium]|nr:GDP-L-fucose synthase [Candidatus Paceibacterota bacterium]